MLGWASPWCIERGWASMATARDRHYYTRSARLVTPLAVARALPQPCHNRTLTQHVEPSWGAERGADHSRVWQLEERAHDSLCRRSVTSLRHGLLIRLLHVLRGKNEKETQPMKGFGEECYETKDGQ
jgi:hypothetical protein